MFSFLSLKSQTYYPTGKDSTSFYFTCMSTDITPGVTYSIMQYTFKGDTIINGKIYTKAYELFHQIDTTYNINSLAFNYNYVFAVRDSSKKIFTVNKNDTTEKLVLDFGLSVGDTLQHYVGYLESAQSTSVLVLIDSFLVNYPVPHYRKRHHFSGSLLAQPVVEGLSTQFFYGANTPLRYTTCGVCCVQQKKEIVYRYCDTCNCFDELDRFRRLDLNNNSHFAELRIYPNPFQEKLFVEPPKDNGVLQLMDVSGRILHNEKFENQEFFNLETTNIPSGIYILSVFQGGKILRAKVIKK